MILNPKADDLQSFVAIIQKLSSRISWLATEGTPWLADYASQNSNIEREVENSNLGREKLPKMGFEIIS